MNFQHQVIWCDVHSYLMTLKSMWYESEPEKRVDIIVPLIANQIKGKG